MVSFKAHFDGTAILLDEPATLAVGQEVRVVVELDPEMVEDHLPTLAGFAKGTFKMSDDFNDPLDSFAEYQ